MPRLRTVGIAAAVLVVLLVTALLVALPEIVRRVAIDQLTTRTGRAVSLKRVEFNTPERLIGKSTYESIQSGVVIGYACLVEGMIERFRKELGGDTRSVLTGGLAEVMAPNLTGIDVLDPWLVLKGLRIIYSRNVD